MVYHFWLTARPLSAGDWPLIPDEQLRTWFPWPTVWWPEVGFGLKNFAGIYEVPIEAIGGLLSLASANWGIVEKVLYFIPFAILSFVAPWILAREILRSSAWALLSALIFGTSTYFITFSAGGQMYLGVAEALAPIVFFALIRTLRRLSIRWALATGLLLGLQAAYEVRITYLTVGLCVLYAVVLVSAEAFQRHTGRRAVLLATALLVLAGTQVYWILPLITFKGDTGLPIAQGPWVAFMQLANGITGVAPYWTGAVPAIFERVPVNPGFFLFPILAFLALNARRISAELLWLCLSALVAAFLIKQTNPPAGEVYQWMFFHVPGWNLFREGSKFYFIVAIAYAVLIPSVLRDGLRFQAKTSAGRLVAQVGSISALLAVVALSAGNLIPLEKGQIGYTTLPIERPVAVRELDTLLSRDTTYGAVLWMAGAWFTDRSGPDPNLVSDHNFVTRSVRHPVVELLGNQGTGDPLAAFCRDPSVGFCYLDGDLFPYLVHRAGVRYVVAPATPRVGRMEVGVGYQDILDRLRSILGTPDVLGDGNHGLAVWKLPAPTSPVVAAPAIAVIDGSTQATQDALPALQSLGLPVAYDGNHIGSLSPLGSSAIQVVPRLDGAYTVPASTEYVLLASSSKGSFAMRDGAVSLSLPRAIPATRAVGWAAFGPIFLDRGYHAITASSIAPGPLIAWSQLSKQLLSGAGFEETLDASVLNAEQVVSPPSQSDFNWIELRRTFDPGWQLDSSRTHIVGDGLFNLYLAESKPVRFTFSFSTQIWEALGFALSLLVVSGVLIGCLLAVRRTAYSRPVPHGTSRATPAEYSDGSSSPGGRYLAQAGIVLLGIAAIFQAIGWYSNGGNHDWFASVFTNNNPYGEATYLTAAAMLMLIAASTLHLTSFSAPYKKPQEIYNFIRLHTALVEDRLTAAPPAYVPIDWSTALKDLNRLFPRAMEFLSESEVNRLEAHIRQKMAGMANGPWAQAFNSDLTLARCVYIVCRALAPATVVETGVAYGLSSAFVLQALAVNGSGTLHSIDLPLPGTSANVTGALIPEDLRNRWQLHLGSSERELPKIVTARPVDVFVHDSLHTYRNMRREFQTVWPRLAAGGVLVSDDIEGNRAFKELLMERPEYWEVVRQEGKSASLFGIAIKRGVIPAH